MILKILTKDFSPKHLAMLRSKACQYSFNFYTQCTEIQLKKGCANFFIREDILYFLVPNKAIPNLMKNYPHWSQTLLIVFPDNSAEAVNTINCTIEKDEISIESYLNKAEQLLNF